MAQLREVSPQALNRLEQLDLKLWANYIALCLQRYGYNTPNIVEVMSNWIPQERRYSILDLLRALGPDVWTTGITLYWQHNSMTELLLLPSIRPIATGATTFRKTPCNLFFKRKLWARSLIHEEDCGAGSPA